jgi:hypothetical protein
LVLLLALEILGQNALGASAAEERHYPTLIHAEVPLYPPLALTAHISGKVEVEITVEKGSVVDAQVKSPSFPGSPSLSNPSLANVKTWKFRKEPRTTFLVTFIYQIEGEQTPLPENPRVELDLPHLVKVTAKPFKPTRT